VFFVKKISLLVNINIRNNFFSRLRKNTIFKIIGFMKNYKLYLLSFGLLFFAFNNAIAQDGCVAGDCKSGIGTWEWSSGASYTGHFQNGTRDGYGQYVFPNSDVYIGEWQNNQFHGYGAYYYNDRPGFKSYSGEWLAGKRSGIGLMYYDDKDIQPRFGVWKENNFLYKYDNLGCSEGDCYNSYGVYTWNDGIRYEGNFREGKRDGEGVYYYASGAKYIGSQSNDGRHGWGTYYYPTGSKFVGEWVSELKDGKGTMFAKGGVVQKGIWKDGKFTKQELTSTSLADNRSPVITIISPEVIASRNGGPRVVVKEKEIYVEGTATDESGIEQVRVSGGVSEMTNIDNKTSRFGSNVILAEGQTKFWVEATDKAGNLIKEEFVIIYEPEGIAAHTAKNPDINPNVDSETRTALIIGNANYMDIPPLRNSKNDAVAMAAKLKDLDFEVELLTDASEDQMLIAIRDFGKKLKASGGVGLFYYAGHGLQLSGQNYLVPTDANIHKSSDIEFETVELKRVLKELEFAKNRLNIVILDACRDNPYELVDHTLRGGNLRGLTSTNAPSGTYIAYSTSPGKAASDGKGENGLYTEMLLKALEESKCKKIEDVFKKVRGYVLEESNNMQIPWENTSITGDFYFYCD